MKLHHESLLQNPFFRESKRNRMEHEYESEREPRSILQVPRGETGFVPSATVAEERVGEDSLPGRRSLALDVV
jgi:hypothetical protein